MKARNLIPLAAAAIVGVMATDAAAANSLSCIGGSCQTSPTPLPNNVHESVQWDPCDGEPFSWEAEFAFEPNYDYVEIGGQRYDGWNGAASDFAEGPVSVVVHTDFVVRSGGLASLTAICHSRFQEAECPHHGLSEYDTSFQGLSVGYPNVRTDKDGYTGNGYIEAVSTSFDPTESTNEVAYHFYTQAGQYKLYFLVNTNGNGAQDSFFYTLGHAANANWQVVNGLASLGWGWNWGSSQPFTLSEGPNPITIRSREAGLSIDRVALIRVGDPAPTGLGGRAFNCSTSQVACDPVACPPDYVCCDNGDSTFSCTTEAQCPWRYSPETPISCDSSTDCDFDQVCAYVNQAGNEIITCVAKHQLTPVQQAGPTLMLPLCSAGGSAESSCPAPWGSCEELVSDALDIYACQVQ